VEIMPIALALVAMLLELCFGYPERLFRAIGHPVTWIGWLIAALDHSINRESAGPKARRLAGALALVGLLALVAAIAIVLQYEVMRLRFGFLLLALLAGAFIAQRSLHRHVADVAEALDKGGLDSGRAAVARIVGRNPGALDAAGVARAAIESLAENFSDGVVAPIIWLVIGGLPGIALYKAINTADSMIGHRTARHEAFGWAAARLDDLVNLPASRLSALLLIGAAALTKSASAAAAWRAVRRDAPRHRSPNAGYPEAAMAGALKLSLAGPRVYGATRVDDVFVGEGRTEANGTDIRRALALFRRADALLIAILAAASVLLIAPI
jgi:adenosylcobinamide-phosphate synthase